MTCEAPAKAACQHEHTLSPVPNNSVPYLLNEIRKVQLELENIALKEAELQTDLTAVKLQCSLRKEYLLSLHNKLQVAQNVQSQLPAQRSL